MDRNQNWPQLTSLCKAPTTLLGFSLENLRKSWLHSIRSLIKAGNQQLTLHSNRPAIEYTGAELNQIRAPPLSAKCHIHV